MSCPLYHELLASLEGVKDCYDPSIDETFYHFYDVALLYDEIYVILDNVALLLQLLKESSITSEKGYNTARREKLPILADKLYDVVLLQKQLPTSLKSPCGKKKMYPMGDRLYNGGVGEVLYPIISSNIKGPLPAVYDKLLAVIEGLSSS